MILLTPLFKKLDDSVGRIGFQPTMVKIIRKSQTKLEINFADKLTRNQLAKSPGILVVNHPEQYEVITVYAGLSHRSDIYMVSESNLMGLGPNLDRHLIPVYVNHHLINPNRKNYRERLFQMFHRSSQLCYNDAHQKNIASFAHTAKLINHGALIILFPDAGTKKNWLPGLGHLLPLVTHSDARYFSAYVKGTSLIDYLRLIPPLSKILPTIKVNYAPSIKISSLPHLPPRPLVAHLEKQYLDWCRSLNSTHK